MNWITFVVLGGVAAWFEYSYQRSRHAKHKAGPSDAAAATPSETADVAQPGEMPSIPPGAENDKRMNTAV